MTRRYIAHPQCVDASSIVSGKTTGRHGVYQHAHNGRWCQAHGSINVTSYSCTSLCVPKVHPSGCHAQNLSHCFPSELSLTNSNFLSGMFCSTCSIDFQLSCQLSWQCCSDHLGSSCIKCTCNSGNISASLSEFCAVTSLASTSLFVASLKAS